MGQRRTVYLDDVVIEALDSLVEGYKLSFSEVVNALLLEAIANSDVMEELKAQAIHKKHVERRKRLMWKLGFAGEMVKVLKEAERRGMEEDDLIALAEEFRAEAEALGILDRWEEGIRRLYNEHRQAQVATSYVERFISEMIKEDWGE